MSGVGNTKFGNGALKSNTSGSNNSAYGSYSATNNTIGESNSAFGTNANLLNVSGNFNTAVGTSSLLHNTASGNTAVGSNAMEMNGGGQNNVAIGISAGHDNVYGSNNTYIGAYSGYEDTGSNNTFLGANITNTSNHNNATVIGCGANALVDNGITLGTNTDKVLIAGDAYIGSVSSNNAIATMANVNGTAVTGINFTNPCTVATTTPIDLQTGNVRTQTTQIDGVQLTSLNGKRILIRCQGGSSDNEASINEDNGIYIYNDASGNFSRASDCSGNNVSGQSMFVTSGTLNAKWIFRQNEDGVAGQDGLEYVQAYQIQFQVGDGLTYDNNIISVKPELTDPSGNPFLTDVKFLGDVSVNGHLFAGNGIDCCRNVHIFDVSNTTNNFPFTIHNSLTRNIVGISTNVGNGSYNKMSQLNDCVLYAGDLSGGGPTNSFVVGCWTSSIACGTRYTGNNVVTGCGGSSVTPNNRITIDSDYMTFDAVNINSIKFNRPINMSSVDASDRVIQTSTVQLNTTDATAGQSQLYQRGIGSCWDNTTTGGNILFAVRDGIGAKYSPMTIQAKNITIPAEINQSSLGSTACRMTQNILSSDLSGNPNVFKYSEVQMNSSSATEKSTLIVKNSSINKSISFLNNPYGTNFNPLVDAGSQVILGSHAAIDTNASLCLTVWGTQKCGLKMKAIDASNATVEAWADASNGWILKGRYNVDGMTIQHTTPTPSANYSLKINDDGNRYIGFLNNPSGLAYNDIVQEGDQTMLGQNALCLGAIGPTGIKCGMRMSNKTNGCTVESWAGTAGWALNAQTRYMDVCGNINLLGNLTVGGTMTWNNLSPVLKTTILPVARENSININDLSVGMIACYYNTSASGKNYIIYVNDSTNVAVGTQYNISHIIASQSNSGSTIEVIFSNPVVLSANGSTQSVSLNINGSQNTIITYVGPVNGIKTWTAIKY